MNATCITYKGVEYKTRKEVDDAYFTGNLTDEEYDELFDMVAIFCEGLVCSKGEED